MRRKFEIWKTENEIFVPKISLDIDSKCAENEWKIVNMKYMLES